MLLSTDLATMPWLVDIEPARTMAYDPCPPADTVSAYERPARDEHRPDDGFLAALLRSLHVHYDPEQRAHEQVAKGITHFTFIFKLCCRNSKPVARALWQQVRMYCAQCKIFSTTQHLPIMNDVSSAMAKVAMIIRRHLILIKWTDTGTVFMPL